MKINGIEYDLKNIVIYGDGAKLFESKRGYLEEYAESSYNKHFSSVYDGKVYNLILPGEIKNARKENLNRKDNYIIYTKGNYSFDSGYTLYINYYYIDVQKNGFKLANEISGEKNYFTDYFLVARKGAEFQFKRMRAEYHGVNPDEYKTLKLKDVFPGAIITTGVNYGSNREHPTIAFYNNENSKFTKKTGNECGYVLRWFETENSCTMHTTSGHYDKTEKDTERVNREKIAEKFNSVLYGRTLSHYDIEKLLTVAKIELV